MIGNELDVDLLVVGGGMAGMSAAAFAARAGARVVVVEKAPEPGGSAVLSGGGFLRPDTPQDFIDVNPSGDPAFASLIASDYDAAVEWVRSVGAHVTEPNPAVREVMGYPTSVRGIDVVTYIARCKTVIESAGSWVVTGADVLRLVNEGGVVTGAVVADHDGETEVRARRTVLAAGGFHNDPELRGRYLGKHARNLTVRGNLVSDGAGLRLATAVGGSTTEHMDRFYGHTVPWPLNREFARPDYVRLIQAFLSTRAVLVNHDGRRFTDESWGYYRNSWAVVQQREGHALLIGDQRLRDADLAGSAPEETLGYEKVDRVVEARSAGGHVAEAATLDELDAAAARWGYPGVKTVIERFNAEVATRKELNPPRHRNRMPLDTPPYFAIEIQSVITQTWGGIRIDDRTHVLDTNGKAIPGLLAAGADIGGAFHETYCGGLGLACMLGLRAARTTLHELGITGPAANAGTGVGGREKVSRPG